MRVLLDPGKLVGKAGLAAELEGLGLALDLVERALHLLEPGEGIGDALVIEIGAQAQARGGALVPRRETLLARLGVGELGLELGDVDALLLQRLLKAVELALLER